MPYSAESRKSLDFPFSCSQRQGNPFVNIAAKPRRSGAFSSKTSLKKQAIKEKANGLWKTADALGGVPEHLLADLLYFSLFHRVCQVNFGNLTKHLVIIE